MELGDISRRFVFAVAHWPWQLGLLIGDVPDADCKHTLAHELLVAEPCCLDEFTVTFRSGAVVEEHIFEPHKLLRLREICQPAGEEQLRKREDTGHHISQQLGGLDSSATGHVLVEVKMSPDSGLACRRWCAMRLENGLQSFARALEGIILAIAFNYDALIQDLCDESMILNSLICLRVPGKAARRGGNLDTRSLHRDQLLGRGRAAH